MKKIFAILFSCILCAPLSAQQMVGRMMHSKKPTKEIKDALEVSRKLFEDMLPATAKVIVIDSVVCPRQQMLAHIPHHVSVGKIEVGIKDTIMTYSMEDEFATRRILSLPIEDGTNRIFLSELIGGKWTAPLQIELEGGFTDIIAPVLFCDGITLYFAAKGGPDNLGGYDIYSTIFDTEEEAFLKPQNMGLPYNSFDDDILYIHDDYNELAWLVTNRRMETPDNVCIYTLVPTEARETYTDVTSLDELSALAHLSDISLTQKDKKALKTARSRLKAMR